MQWTYPDGYESQYYSYYDLPGDLRAYTLTGVALCTIPGGGGGRWHSEQLSVLVDIPDLPPFPPKNALKLHHWAPFFTLNAISNDGPANDAGWAVNRWNVSHPGGASLNDPLRQVGYTVDLAVGDSDGFILRVGYIINLVGQLV
jgi:hypothetical protein